MDLTDLSVLRNPGAARRSHQGVLALVVQAEQDLRPVLRNRSGLLISALATDETAPAVTKGEQLLALLAELDAWLVPFGDRPTTWAFGVWRGDALKSQPEIDQAAFQATRSLLSSEIIESVPDWVAVRRLTRLALLIELLDPAATTAQELTKHRDDRDYVFDMLRRRTPLFPRGLYVPVPEPKIALVRGAKVSDLFVVRSEWSCYLPGEVAAITNVLAHELLSTTSTRTDEQELTVTREAERLEITEQTEEDRTQTEITREVSRAQELQLKAEASFNVSGQYGLTTFAAAASAGINASLSESSRQASRIAREVVSKAVTSVESRVREERIQRNLTRSVVRTRHEIDNDSDVHMQGVYRWVDRVDRFQIFRYPDRFQLEFEIPEPAAYLRYRLTSAEGGELWRRGQTACLHGGRD